MGLIDTGWASQGKRSGDASQDYRSDTTPTSTLVAAGGAAAAYTPAAALDSGLITGEGVQRLLDSINRLGE